MTEFDNPELAQLLAQLEFRLAEPVDFARVDEQNTTAKVRLLSAATVYFNVLAVNEFGGRPGPVRQAGLVEQVVATAFQTYRGEDPHPLPFDKGAMLLRGITQGHPFTDGNKRTGFLLAAFYLDRVGLVLHPNLPTVEVISFCRRVSAGEVRDLKVIAPTLRTWTLPRQESQISP
jgi:prophage maintenance system killer protein